MASLAIAALAQPKRVHRPRIDRALHFIDTIESTWKGHEAFAMRLVRKVRPKTVVDLGFDRGLSTLAFAYRNGGHVYGIDWFEEGNYAAKSFALDSAFRNISTAIRFNFAKNIHLIIGPFCDVSKKWTRQIDILHIDWAHTYSSVKHHYYNWIRFLKPKGVILVHDVASYPEETGRFFNELALPKFLFPHSNGLGVASEDAALVESIRAEWGKQTSDFP